ncbi:MAG: 30S ribosomal protein S13 [Thaumarchaeota archaeon]|nr:30S ribosomal protein S13 [Nitrososphaerota archaeon]
MTTQEYRYIVRIVGSDIPGDKKTLIGLTQVRGIGYNFANAILDSLKINPNTNIGYLTDSQVQSIEKILKNPLEVNFPTWFLNRRKDIQTGEDKHLITSDIAFTVRNDIEREKATNSWRGFRHMYGLKVRGQRTRTTGRKGGAVGVAKGGKILPAKAEGKAPAAEGKAPAAEGKAPAAEGKAPAAEGKAPAAEGKAPAAEGKAKTADKKGDSAAGKKADNKK